MKLFRIIARLLMVLVLCKIVRANTGLEQGERYKLTAYCSCPKCCGRFSDGYFANGDKVSVGGVANNSLAFGTQLKIEGFNRLFIVKDRGSRKYFGSKSNPIKALDIYMTSHKQAKQFGVRYAEVRIIK